MLAESVGIFPQSFHSAYALRTRNPRSFSTAAAAKMTSNAGRISNFEALSQPEGSEVRSRWETFAKDEAIEPILELVLLETRADQLLRVASAKTVSTNVFMRRLQNFCVGMN